MQSVEDNIKDDFKPIITYTLVGLNILIYLWDRELGMRGSSIVFADLGMRPANIIQLFNGGDPFQAVTLFTGLFLHGNLSHILANMIGLYTFGAAIESTFGGFRFLGYYLLWGLASSGLHILMNLDSGIPVIGASGAIGGIMGCYFWLYPKSKLAIVIPPVFIPVVVSAWVILGGWFLLQIFLPQEGVANRAHAGGFLAGLLTVYLLGGRKKVIKNAFQDPQLEYEEDSND